MPKCLAMKPPTIAPTTPSAMSMSMPDPGLLTILLADEPAISPRMIQLMTPIPSLPFGRLVRRP